MAMPSRFNTLNTTRAPWILSIPKLHLPTPRPLHISKSKPSSWPPSGHVKLHPGQFQSGIPQMPQNPHNSSQIKLCATFMHIHICSCALHQRLMSHELPRSPKFGHPYFLPFFPFAPLRFLNPLFPPQSTSLVYSHFLSFFFLCYLK